MNRRDRLITSPGARACAPVLRRSTPPDARRLAVPRERARHPPAGEELSRRKPREAGEAPQLRILVGVLVYFLRSPIAALPGVAQLADPAGPRHRRGDAGGRDRAARGDREADAGAARGTRGAEPAGRGGRQGRAGAHRADGRRGTDPTARTDAARDRHAAADRAARAHRACRAARGRRRRNAHPPHDHSRRPDPPGRSLRVAARGPAAHAARGTR